MSATTTTISAPGKVLIAGGYLVLDRDYSGLVVSTSSRFYASISSRSSIPVNTITVRSPQFKDATWNYSVQLNDALGAPIVNPDAANASQNKFVHLALEKTLAVARDIQGAPSIQNAFGTSNGLDIAIIGHNDFYSQSSQLASLGLKRSFTSLEHLTPFAATGVTLSHVHKTGLGSSAALITSLVTALLVHLRIIPADSLSGSDLAHNLAQYVHCLAQGKVGSGFDVSAAVFGSHLYTRFDPDVISSAMNESASQQPLLNIVSHENQGWNHLIQPFRLPPSTRILLADVDAGSDTPSLVGKVLKWRNAEPDKANSLWRDLSQQNLSMATYISRLSSLHEASPGGVCSSAFVSALRPNAFYYHQWISHPGLPEGQGEIVSTFFQLHDAIQTIREYMKSMGDSADVPIEPQEQTDLLDKCTEIAGVVGGGVPGAGGYDAIWLLVLDPVDPGQDEETPTARVDRTWSAYNELKVSPLSASESVDSGVRLEDPSKIPGLMNAIGV
ncbi:Phosphomevalonate kinase [Flagelloscypha sp. PMI_526]|nr:Phosphomevalonate kinase [Flagelloscypha sp. PMI_526]